MLSFVNNETEFFEKIPSLKGVHHLNLDNNTGLIDQLSEEAGGINALYYEGGTLLIDDYSSLNKREEVYRLISLLSMKNKPVRSVQVAKTEDIAEQRRERTFSDTDVSREIDKEETLQQFQGLMTRALDVNAEDVYITLSQANDTAFANFKVDGRLIPEQYPLKNYRFGRSMCAAVYDGIGGIGMTAGTFDEVTTPQEKQIPYKVYDGRGGIRQRLDLRFTKTKTSRPGELYIDMRLTKKAKKLSELGYPKDQLELIHRKTSKARGVVITAGPTGSGKSTTNFAILLGLPKDKNYQTFEDPIETEKPPGYPNIIQNSMDLKVGTKFQLKSILRQTPNGVFVQESRDEETARFTLEVGNTGLFALTSTHAPSAIAIPKRFNDLGVSYSDMAMPQGLSLLMYQVLIRMLCSKCKVPLDESKTLIEAEFTDRQRYFSEVGVTGTETGLYIRNPDGCDECLHTGEKGRRPLLELIDVKRKDRQFILAEDWSGWEAYLLENGYITVQQQAKQLVKAGVIDIDRCAELLVGEE